MAEKKQEELTEHIVLPELPEPPEKPETPEDGFVPYAAEAAKEEAGNTRKVVFALILVLLIVVGVIVIAFGRKFNFYHETIDTLKFDYRNGEVTGEPYKNPAQSYAVQLAELAHSKQINATVVHYQFNEQKQLDPAVTKYHYAFNVNEIRADIKKGTKDWYGAKEQTIHRTDTNGYEIMKGGKWVEDDKAYIPPLYTYLFEIGETATRKFEWHQAYDSVVNGRLYTCEIWLLTDTSSGEPVYLTIYRYYQNGTLSAVRIANQFDMTLQVYDVQSYSMT